MYTTFRTQVLNEIASFVFTLQTGMQISYWSSTSILSEDEGDILKNGETRS